MSKTKKVSQVDKHINTRILEATVNRFGKITVSRDKITSFWE